MAIGPWPEDYERIPDDDWTREPVDEFAAAYDRLGAHGWYANLDRLVDDLAAFIQEGHIVVDYSGGTGLLVDRLLQRLPERSFGIVNVDASAKFLRFALEKHRDEPRAAWRFLRYQPERHRLQPVDEVLGLELLMGVAAVACANAIHLYPDLAEVVSAWHRILRPGGRALVQSGNIRRRDVPAGRHIIDDTVHAIAAEAEAIVREDDQYAGYRETLTDWRRMAAHAALRDRYFLPVRPVDDYLDVFSRHGFAIESVRHEAIRVDRREWMEFLSVYHDGILSWIGGSPKVEGHEPSRQAVGDRLALMMRASRRVFDDADSFDAEWTYITARRTV